MHIRKLDEIWRGKGWNKLPSVTCPKEEKASLRDFSSADHDNPETTSFYDLSVTVKTGDWAYGVTGEREREREEPPTKSLLEEEGGEGAEDE